MSIVRSFTTATLATMTFVSVAVAQKTVQTNVGGGGSPHVTSTWMVGGANISIAYGRPSLKGRPEDKMMPAGEPWRTGADEATVITSDKPLTFGTIKLPAGSHTIFTEPGTGEWKFIVGKLDKAGQWGTPYLPQFEIGRAPMKIGKASASAEQVTYSIDNVGSTHVLRIEWGTKSATIPFTIGA
ncbi:MAG TPA: DUF2911 domain-containing protein [Gemmatimonadaceae bacterium]|jgi:hypothetical protein